MLKLTRLILIFILLVLFSKPSFSVFADFERVGCASPVCRGFDDLSAQTINNTPTTAISTGDNPNTVGGWIAGMYGGGWAYNKTTNFIHAPADKEGGKFYILNNATDLIMCFSVKTIYDCTQTPWVVMTGSGASNDAINDIFCSADNPYSYSFGINGATWQGALKETTSKEVRICLWWNNTVQRVQLTKYIPDNGSLSNFTSGASPNPFYNGSNFTFTSYLLPTQFRNISLWNYSKYGLDGCKLGYCIWEPEVINITEIKPVLKNESGQVYDIDALLPFQPFYVMMNHTINAIMQNCTNANFTSKNISAYFLKTGTDTNLNSANQIIELDVSESAVNLLFDTITLRVCRVSGAPTPLNIYVNGSLHESLSLIPVCSVGSFSYVNVSYAYITKDALNVSLRCPGCSAGNVLKVLGTDLLNFERKYTLHTEILTFNATTRLSEFKNHQYTYVSPGEKNLTFRCDGIFYNRTFFVGDSSPVITMLSINDRDFVEGMNISSNYTTYLISDIIGDPPLSITFNVTYFNGSLVASGIKSYLTLNNTQINQVGIYNISITAVDKQGNSTNFKGSFNIADTITPRITWLIPSHNGTAYDVSPLFELKVKVTDDLLLYIINVSITDNTTEFYRDSVNITGLEYTYIKNINSSAFTNSTIYIDVRVCDGHTAQALTMLNTAEIIRSSDSLKIEKDGTLIEIKSLEKPSSLDYSVENDRISYSFTFMDAGIKTYSLTSTDDITYLPASPFKGHFIIGSKYWVDFENPYPTIPRYECVNKTCMWLIDIQQKEGKTAFNSVGEINCQSSRLYIEWGGFTGGYSINMLPRNFFNNKILDFSTIAGVLILFFMLFAGIALIVFGEYVLIPAVMLFGGLYWVFFGMLVFVSITAIFGVIIVILGLFYVIRSIVFAR